MAITFVASHHSEFSVGNLLRVFLVVQMIFFFSNEADVQDGRRAIPLLGHELKFLVPGMRTEFP